MKNRDNLSTLSLAILGLISHSPRSGYDLRKLFTTTPMGHFSNSPGAIYPALKRLEERDLVKGRVEDAQTLRPRRVYTLTERGTQIFKQRLGQPVTEDDVIWRIDDLVLRFAFMGEALGREKTLDFLREFLSRVEAYMPSLQGHFNTVRTEASPYGAFALENGIEVYHAHIRWAKHVIKQLQGN